MRSQSQLAWRSWDDGTVIFDPQTGDTHLLDVVASEAMKIVDASPLSAEALVNAVAARLEIEADQQLRDYIDRLIGQLYGLGLLECRAP